MTPDEIAVMNIKKEASKWGFTVVALQKPLAHSDYLKATSVVKVLGILVADGYLPLDEYEKALKK